MATEALLEDLPREIDVDPFAYQPGVGTRIAGLVDGEMGNDPGYVFHTDYFECGRGMAIFKARFAGLKAKEGTLQLRIHMLLPGETPRLALANSERILLSRLALGYGYIELKFEAFRDVRYAFYATVIGNTDAHADALSITLERPEPQTLHKDENTEARNSSFGHDSSQASASLLSPSSPNLRFPVTQMATPAQLKDPAAKEWAGKLGASVRSNSLMHWASLYTLRALDTYGVLTSGARGLALGAAAGEIAPLVASRTAEVIVALEPEKPAPPIVEDAPNVSRCTAPHAALGTALNNFDFFWSMELESHYSLAADWIAWVEEAVSCLLPGGLGVFTFGYNPEVTMRRDDSTEAIGRVGRAEVDRAALILISRGHQVAQLRLAGHGAPLTSDRDWRHSAAGLIVRRASLVL